MRRLTRRLVMAALAGSLAGGLAAAPPARAQHVVTPQEASRLSFDALTAPPPRTHQVGPSRHHVARRHLGRGYHRRR